MPKAAPGVSQEGGGAEAPPRVAQARQPRRGGDGDRRVNVYRRSLLERDTAALEADLAWLDRLIADEQAAMRDEPGGTPS